MPEELVEAVTAEDMEAAFKELLPKAEALADGEVISFPGDADLAQHNAKEATKVVLDRQADLGGKFSDQEIQTMAETPKVAAATVFASNRVSFMVTDSPKEIAEKMVRARKVRKILLLGAQACAEAGHIPTKDVRTIEKGRGFRDVATDDVDLAALYRKYPAELENRTPATPEMIQEAAELGTELLSKIKPSRAFSEKIKPEELTAAMAIRDRFWTLLVQHHEAVWKAGAHLFGRAVDDHVPALLSRKRAPKPREEAPTGG
jgi:hypothetical protein